MFPGDIKEHDFEKKATPGHVRRTAFVDRYLNKLYNVLHEVLVQRSRNARRSMQTNVAITWSRELPRLPTMDTSWFETAASPSTRYSTKYHHVSQGHSSLNETNDRFCSKNNAGRFCIDSNFFVHWETFYFIVHKFLLNLISSACSCMTSQARNDQR